MLKRVLSVIITLFVAGLILCSCSFSKSGSTQAANATQTLNKATEAQSTTDTANSSEPSTIVKSIEYIDGVYEGKTDLTSESYYGKVKVTIKNGQIKDVAFEIYDDARNKLVDKSYGEEVFADNPEFQEQTKNDLAGAIKYSSLLVSKQDVDKVDAISGATWSYNLFRQAIEITLKKAEKVIVLAEDLARDVL